MEWRSRNLTNKYCWVAIHNMGRLALGHRKYINMLMVLLKYTGSRTY